MSLGRTPRPLVLKNWQILWMMRLFPPLLFNRIRLESLSPDLMHCRVRIAHSFINRNLQGSVFGGTLFSALDPFLPVMMWQIFARRGQKLESWLKKAEIDYLKPSSTTMMIDFRLTEGDIQEAEHSLVQKGKFEKWLPAEAIDQH
ncbi:MAG: DUF4442 domain-containing protein, partial [Bacteroidetes bacterium]|nr:DUF4442 domain-containing protein [Bacteroidota bacterium]